MSENHRNNDRILVVDDERSMAMAMAQLLRRNRYDVDVVHDAREALGQLSRREYGLVFSDLRMPGMDGRELLNRIRISHPALPVVLVTAFATVESAVRCVREGARDYLMKPFSPEALLAAAATALRNSKIKAVDSVEVIAEDPSILRTLELARKAAASDVTVLLEAESGAGKEVFTRVIHRESPRRDGPFVAVNCAALPRELLEAELFGHCKGAFTGAHRDRKGHFLAANGGTLLLDEIGEMNPDLQARLLRVLQDHQIQPIGSDETIDVDVRVIAATNRKLKEDVRCGRFREDLYYRLAVMEIRIPSLRERPRDIEPLARRFVSLYADKNVQITDAALALLKQHDWPGNVRELENAIQRASILAGSDPIDCEHFDLQPALRSTRHDKIDAAAWTLEEAEWEAIRRTLLHTGGNRSKAALALGISPRTLRHKLKGFRDAGHPVLTEQAS